MVDSEEQLKFKAILSELSKIEGNRECAECGSKAPRWTSHNLGIFICMKCAGFHRNLGPNISKVKSLNLDKWTSAQIENMKNIGNTKSKKYYEANLPVQFRRPLDDRQMMNFLRNKYEKKMYASSEDPRYFYEKETQKDIIPKEKEQQNKKKIVESPNIITNSSSSPSNVQNSSHLNDLDLIFGDKNQPKPLVSSSSSSANNTNGEFNPFGEINWEQSGNSKGNSNNDVPDNNNSPLGVASPSQRRLSNNQILGLFGASNPNPPSLQGNVGVQYPVYGQNMQQPFMGNNYNMPGFYSQNPGQMQSQFIPQQQFQQIPYSGQYQNPNFNQAYNNLYHPEQQQNYRFR